MDPFHPELKLSPFSVVKELRTSLAERQVEVDSLIISVLYHVGGSEF